MRSSRWFPLTLQEHQRFNVPPQQGHNLTKNWGSAVAFASLEELEREPGESPFKNVAAGEKPPGDDDEDDVSISELFLAPSFYLSLSPSFTLSFPTFTCPIFLPISSSHVFFSLPFSPSFSVSLLCSFLTSFLSSFSSNFPFFSSVHTFFPFLHL